ncbi:MAG: hypothetical protein SCK29_13215 [Bacillota bacterium]|nr:hypothetical protein [Bacillota bacterium]
MLSKLLKYELKATARIFLPLYAVLLSFALINRLITSVSSVQGQPPQVISMIIYISILVAMFVITFIMMIQRFYKNLLSDEGYLMFTLPTKAWKHIISKLLVSILWIITSILAALISIFLISADRTTLTELMNAVKLFNDNIAAYINASTVVFALELSLISLASLASGILIIYASIAIGHLFNQHRIIASIGAFIALSTVSQILYVVIGSVLSFSIDLNTIEAIGPVVHFAMLLIVIFHGVFGAGYFIITNYILSKRLNLE